MSLICQLEDGNARLTYFLGPTGAGTETKGACKDYCPHLSLRKLGKSARVPVIVPNTLVLNCVKKSSYLLSYKLVYNVSGGPSRVAYSRSSQILIQTQDALFTSTSIFL
jgi:hypothetical protein